MASEAKANMHNNFAYQKGFREMVNFPQEDLPVVKECKGPWASSPPRVMDVSATELTLGGF